jgi:hypothetical protein
VQHLYLNYSPTEGKENQQISSIPKHPTIFTGEAILILPSPSKIPLYGKGPGFYDKIDYHYEK